MADCEMIKESHSGASRRTAIQVVLYFFPPLDGAADETVVSQETNETLQAVCLYAAFIHCCGD